MGLELEQFGDRSVLHLTEPVAIGSAAELQRLLVQASEAERPLEVAFALDAELDISAIQLLCAAREASARQSVKFAIAGTVPEAVAAAFRDAGLDPFLPFGEQA
jgi:phage tail sheath gpL-like